MADKVYDLRAGDRVTHYKHGNGNVVRALENGLVEVRFGKRTEYVEFRNLVPTERLELEERSRREREREAALLREEERKRWAQHEARRQANERKRAALLPVLRKWLQADFIGSHEFYQAECADVIAEADFVREKHSFVRSWIAAHVTPSRSGKALLPDDEQLAAIAAVKGHVQVVARAGSGKTTTLVNRALFLMKHCAVPPGAILILAFNRNAATEVRKKLLCLMSEAAEAELDHEIDRRARDAAARGRLRRDDIVAQSVDAVATAQNLVLPHVMTFHALAYAIVHPEESILYDGPDGESQGLSRVFQDVIDDHLRTPEHREQIRNLMLAHFRQDWDRIAAGRYDLGRDDFLRFRRSLPRETLRGEYVKSYGEKVLADFLFEHDVDYKYERNFWWDGTNYRPDFTLMKSPKSGVVIEYFGLEGDPDYDEMTEQKRRFWARHANYQLIEVTPADVAGVGVTEFLEGLKARLERLGFPCTKLSEDEIWHRIRGRAIDRFTRAAVSFVGRCRKQSLSPEALQDLISRYEPATEAEAKFLEVAHRLFGGYLSRLAATGEEDFDGLLQRAAAAVENGETAFRRRSGAGDLTALKYVFIDEFQDFSNLFHRLLVAMRRLNPGLELFCVGDDWQAINGFAGSDLRYFERFADHFGDAERLYVSTNYRSSTEVVHIGNSLMHGLGKEAAVKSTAAGKVVVADLGEFEPSAFEREDHAGDILTPAVCRIIGRALGDGMDTVLLARRNGLPWYVNFKEHIGRDGRSLDSFLQLVRSAFPVDLRDRITISTAHKYKGLEKPVVILLDVVERSYPLIHPDWVFSRILGDNPEKITQEERRLLYVAMTRAVNTLVVITESRNKSPFLREVERRRSLTPLDWSEYPAVRHGVTRVMVRVGNQEGRGGKPTIAIKDLLRSAGYQWQTTGWPGWERTFPSVPFGVDTLKNQAWAKGADGIEVRVLDDSEKLIAQFLINNGTWECLVDRLDTLGAPHPTATSH